MDIQKHCLLFVLQNKYPMKNNLMNMLLHMISNSSAIIQNNALTETKAVA